MVLGVGRVTYRGIDDGIPASEKEHCFVGIASVGDLFVPQSICIPVKVPLEEVGDAEFGADEIFHDQLQALHNIV